MTVDCTSCFPCIVHRTRRLCSAGPACLHDSHYGERRQPQSQNVVRPEPCRSRRCGGGWSGCARATGRLSCSNGGSVRGRRVINLVPRCTGVCLCWLFSRTRCWVLHVDPRYRLLWQSALLFHHLSRRAFPPRPSDTYRQPEPLLLTILHHTSIRSDVLRCRLVQLWERAQDALSLNVEHGADILVPHGPYGTGTELAAIRQCAGLCSGGETAGQRDGAGALPRRFFPGVARSRAVGGYVFLVRNRLDRPGHVAVVAQVVAELPSDQPVGGEGRGED